MVKDQQLQQDPHIQYFIIHTIHYDSPCRGYSAITTTKQSCYTIIRQIEGKYSPYRGTIPFFLHLVPWRLVSIFLYVVGVKVSKLLCLLLIVELLILNCYELFTYDVSFRRCFSIGYGTIRKIKISNSNATVPCTNQVTLPTKAFQRYSN
jgi:hypothetical protein